MIEPAVGLIASFWGTRRREDIAKNSSREPEQGGSGCQASTSRPASSPSPKARYKALTMRSSMSITAEFARACAIDIPGLETTGSGGSPAAGI